MVKKWIDQKGKHTFLVEKDHAIIKKFPALRLDHKFIILKYKL